EVFSGTREESKAHGPPPVGLPPIVRADGTNNGFFVRSGRLFWQNEDTAELKDLVERRAFAELLKSAEKSPDSK
ncbi:MAG: hypothetical protein ACREIV_08410, partial [Planctomycetaceae bacterium]